MLVLAAPSVPGIAISIVLFGLGSGLASIVGGTLPPSCSAAQAMALRLGWVSGARQFSSSFAPFIFAFMMAQWSVGISLWWLIFIGAAGVVIFAAITLTQRRSLRRALPQDGALLPADQTG